MATKMATVEKAEELLEKLRGASWDAAVQGREFINMENKLRKGFLINALKVKTKSLCAIIFKNHGYLCFSEVFNNFHFQNCLEFLFVLSNLCR